MSECHSLNPFSHLATARASDSSSLLDYVRVISTPIIIIIIIIIIGLDQRSYSTLGPVSAWMGDRLRACKLSRYVTMPPRSTQPGHTSMGRHTSLGWEGNHRSGVALAMRHRQ